MDLGARIWHSADVLILKLNLSNFEVKKRGRNSALFFCAGIFKVNNSAVKCEEMPENWVELKGKLGAIDGLILWRGGTISLYNETIYGVY